MVYYEVVLVVETGPVIYTSGEESVFRIEVLRQRNPDGKCHPRVWHTGLYQLPPTLVPEMQAGGATENILVENAFHKWEDIKMDDPHDVVAVVLAKLFENIVPSRAENQ